MCGICVSQDPATHAGETRAARLHGRCASIRPEAAFSRVPERIAAAEGASVAGFLSRLHDEVWHPQPTVKRPVPVAGRTLVASASHLRQRKAQRRGPGQSSGRGDAEGTCEWFSLSLSTASTRLE
jgi:predicted DNA-binding ribbon-helix-helix protein